MFRTLKYILKDPRAIIAIPLNFKKSIIIIKSYVILNWIEDIEKADVDKKFKRNVRMILNVQREKEGE